MYPTRFSLFKKGSTYQILFYLHGVRRWKSTGAKTKPEALKALSQFRKLLEDTPKLLFLRDFIPNFLTFGETVYSRKTLEIYQRVLPSFLR